MNTLKNFFFKIFSSFASVTPELVVLEEPTVPADMKSVTTPAAKKPRKPRTPKVAK